MEQNLWNALHCQSTATAFTVLAMYAEAVSYPYMKAIHATDKGQNMLDLGPLHTCVFKHMQKIIDDSNILIGKESAYETATLDGEEWQNADVVKKIQELIPTLPHFCDVLLAFFEGAAGTWE
jgi:hypothetical protein